ncbi:MBL fold metallo-hydrolase [Spirosoma sp. SC4-14]|uniref:MBL fold metallo-hydrolase n=1 Tax=Spirosoma sp. SC4-14 TaxID=3128900 RepID=UPI0030D13111
MQTICSTTVTASTVALWWLGQSGFFVKLANGKILVIDAYLSDSVAKRNPDFRRKTPIPLQPEEVICDYYLCSHNHLDHADPETIARLTNRESMVFIGPRNVLAMLGQLGVNDTNCQLLEAGETLVLDGFRVTGSFCIPNEDRVLDSIGFVLETDDGVTVYHTGDTAYHPFLTYLRKFRIDVLLTCINGKYGNLSVGESYALAGALEPATVIPTHYDMFALNGADPVAFGQLFMDHSTINCLIPTVGELIVCYPKIREA